MLISTLVYTRTHARTHPKGLPHQHLPGQHVGTLVNITFGGVGPQHTYLLPNEEQITLSEISPVDLKRLQMHKLQTSRHLAKTLSRQKQRRQHSSNEQASCGVFLLKVKQALCTMIHQNMMFFERHKRGFVEYGVDCDLVLQRNRYPRFIYAAKMMHGDVGKKTTDQVLL